ncbi:MAG: OmpA family protein [Calditrichae bacterium]|nr:OmpA family protein [Calditrichia bacterium]
MYKNYLDALKSAGMELLAEGMYDAGMRGGGVGSRAWLEVYYSENPFNSDGAVNNMARGTSTSGGRGAIVAKKERAAGTVYVAVVVYQLSDNNISTLIDVVEVAAAETGLVTVDAEAIGNAIAESGRVVLDGILFDYDKATLQAASKAALEQIASYLKANAQQNFYVVGHTDAKGTFAYNQNLSAARARAVVEALVEITASPPPAWSRTGWARWCRSSPTPATPAASATGGWSWWSGSSCQWSDISYQWQLAVAVLCE